MSNQYSEQPIDSSDSDSDRLRTLMDNLNNLKSKLHHFTVIDELGQPLGEISDLILDQGHQLNLVLALTDGRSDAAPVLLNGRRIKKVSVQTQSVFVDITKADTQFLPEYSATEGISSVHPSDLPLPSTAFSDSFADLNFSEEPSPITAAFDSENSTYPTAADRELAESLFATEPTEPEGLEANSFNSEWNLPDSSQPDNIFASWNEDPGSLSELNLLPDQEMDLSNAVSFSADPDLTQALTEDLSGLELSSAELFGSTDELSFAEPVAETTINDFSFEEPASESLANELERLDLSLDNDWSELGTLSQPEATSNSFELTLESDTFIQQSPPLELNEVAETMGDSIIPDQSVNPFAGDLPDLNFDTSPAVVEGLSDLDWTTSAPIEEPTNFTLERDDFSFDLPASDVGGSEEASQPDTIESLTDLNILADEPNYLGEAVAYDEFSPPFAEEISSPAISYDYEQSAPLELQEPEPQNEWLTAVGAGAAGLATGVAAESFNLNPEPVDSLPEDVMSVSAQPAAELDAEVSLLEEQINVEYQRRKIGEVIIRKQIETRMVQVPVRYEKLVIEQVGAEQKTLAEVDLSQGALDNIELTGVNDKPTVSGEFASPAVASQALDAIAKALQNRCKRVRIEIELEDGQMQQAYQDWFDECSQL